MANELVQKIAQAALQVGGALKADKRNKDQNYDYISADKILAIVGQALFTQGVVIIPEVDMQKIDNFDYTDKYGNAKTRYDAQVHFVMNITDGESSLKAEWTGMGSDYSVPDKALYKAITSGHKYFMAKLLSIGEGNEDSEHEPADEQVQPKQERKPAAKPAPAYNPLAVAPAIEYPPELAVVMNAGGIPYVELDNDKLHNMQTGIHKALKNPELTQDQQASYAAKNDAINQILALRGK